MIWIVDNPEGCVNPSVRGDRTCVDCYYSHVKGGQWTGSQRCWDAECLRMDPDRTDPLYKQGIKEETQGR